MRHHQTSLTALVQVCGRHLVPRHHRLHHRLRRLLPRHRPWQNIRHLLHFKYTIHIAHLHIFTFSCVQQFMQFMQLGWAALRPWCPSWRACWLKAASMAGGTRRPRTSSSSSCAATSPSPASATSSATSTIPPARTSMQRSSSSTRRSRTSSLTGCSSGRRQESNISRCVQC